MRCLLALLYLAPLLAQETILLRPDAKVDPSAPPEKVEDRGKGGIRDRAVSNVVQPALTVYLPPSEKATGAAVLICPGGGYARLSIDKEGHDVARWLNTLGVAGLVLKYRLPGGANMKPALGDMEQAATAARVAIEDATAAVRLVRANAARWNVRPNAVGIMGFSAGGHLGAMLGMRAPIDARPDFLALIYPAIPQGLEVTSSTPRTFLAAADDDKGVPPTVHCVRFYLALKAAGVPAELIVYSSGGHGFGLGKPDKTSSAWPQAFAAWLAEWNKR
jgi:acetyl esterase/lipase